MENEERLLISVANKRQQKSRESLTVDKLFPQELLNDIQPIVQFLEAYYDWLNEEKREIETGTTDLKNDVKMRQLSTNLYKIRDLDELSQFVNDDRDIGKMFAELAMKFPRKDVVMDYRTILKNIKTLYAQKGSENAVKSFFRIVFGSNSSVYYPWDDVLIASAGEWDGERFLSNKGFLSDNIHLQDSNYWQRFSYDIKVDQHEVDWRNVFESLLHPAGFKFFASLFLLIIASNRKMPRDQIGVLDSVINSANMFFILIYYASLVNDMKVKHVLTLLQQILFKVSHFSYSGYYTFRRSTFFNATSMEEFDSITFESVEDINRRNILTIGSIVDSILS